jgi:hypothetical protein
MGALLLLLATVSPLTCPNAEFFDKNGGGKRLSGGTIEIYVEGTKQFQALYSDPHGAIPATNPTILDYRGRSNIYLPHGRYRLRVKDSQGHDVYTLHNVRIPVKCP